MRYLCLLFLIYLPVLHAADTRLKQDGVEFFVSARTPEQMRAFYAARGMPPAAVEALSHACFLTIGLHNRRAEKLWLEPAQWRFSDAQGQPVARITRQAWAERWAALDVPRGAQATFGWTQAPESRDLFPDESVGGNVTIVPPTGTFSLTARFRTGAAGDGPMLELTVRDLSCPRDGVAP